MVSFNKGGNYNVPLEYAKESFRKKNPIEMSRKSNSKYDEENNIIYVKYIDKLLKVHYPSGDIYTEDDKPLNKIALEILIIRFLSNANPIPETKKYITYKEIEGGYVYYQAFLNTSIKRLTEEFGDNIDLFEKVMKEINATKLDIGDLAYKIRFLNDTYIVYVIWGGDDEIKPSSNILFDFNIQSYFNAEDIAVVGDMPFIRIYEIIGKNM